MNKIQRERYKARIGHINSDARIWGQYKSMVDFLYEEYPKTNRRFEVIAIPLLFTMSHAVELGLKENIKYLKKYSQSNLLTVFENWIILVKSHDLKSLSKEFKSQFNKTLKKLKAENSIKQEFNKLDKKLENLISLLERGAETYRYASKLDNKAEFIKSSIKSDKEIDFYELQETFTEVDKLLTHSADVISHYTDYIDLIEEKPEYKSGYKNHLWCTVLHVGGGLDDNIREIFDNEMISRGTDKWFDKEQGENIEMIIHKNHAYLLLKK
jgi:hypothetical protein